MPASPARRSVTFVFAREPKSWPLGLMRMLRHWRGKWGRFTTCHNIIGRQQCLPHGRGEAILEETDVRAPAEFCNAPSRHPIFASRCAAGLAGWMRLGER